MRRRVRVGETSDVSPFFADNLEGGQYNDANGFTWAPQALWSVSDDVGGVNGGTHAFKAVFGPDAENVQGQQAEGNLQFALGRDVADLGIEFYIYVGSNFAHRIIVGNSENNKFLGLWRDSINNTNGWRMVLEYLPTDSSMSGTTSIARAIASSSDSNLFDQTVLSDPLINGGGPITAGAWCRVRVRARGGTAALANDGLLYWQAGDTVIANVTNGDYWNQNETYSNVRLNTGYFLGSANSGFTEATAFYLAGFKFFDLNGAEWP